MSAKEVEGWRAEHELKHARAGGEPVAKAILESFAKQFSRLAMHFAPGELTENPRADEVKYAHWAKLAVDVAKALIVYEEAKLAPIPHQAEVIEHQPAAAVRAAVTVDLRAMSAEELIKYYRARISGSRPLATIEHKDPGKYPADPVDSAAAVSAVPTSAPADDLGEDSDEGSVERAPNVIEFARTDDRGAA